MYTIVTIVHSRYILTWWRQSNSTWIKCRYFHRTSSKQREVLGHVGEFPPWDPIEMGDIGIWSSDRWQKIRSFRVPKKKSQHKFIIDSKPWRSIRWRSIRWINDDKWIDHNRLRRLTKLKWVPRRNSKNCVMGSLRQSLSCWKSNRGPMMLVNHQIPSIVHLCTATRPGKRLQVAIEAMTQSK